MGDQRNLPKGGETPKNERLAEALRLARLGFRVIPLKERDKRPLIEDWPNRATWDEATIRGWWAKWPNANIGIATGRYRDGYFCVLDFDPRNGGNWYDDVGPDILPPTWVVHTGGGGRHYYYKTPKLLRSAKLGAGVDLKGDGGYVVAPPSVHPNGERYGWEVGAGPGEKPFADVSEWVLREVAGEAQSAGDGKEGAGLALWRMPPPIPKGMRHNYLVSLAGALWGAGVKEAEIEAVLWGAIELFETREDFDPVAEIGGIIKGLKNWEGEGLDLAIVLRSLPEAVRAIVMREVAAAKDAVARVGKGESRSAAMAKAAEVVSKLEVRQKEDGTACYVYRAPDGREREVPCTPAGVRQLLQELGIWIEQKDAEKLLRIVADAGDEDENKKRRKRPKAAGLEEISEVVWRYKWFEWNGATWVLEPPLISIATLEKVHEILLQNRVEISKERLKTFFDTLMKVLPISPMEGVVVTEAPRYGRAGGLRGVWFRQKGDLYVVTPTEIKHFPFRQWPEDVYVLDLRQRESPIDLNGTTTDLLVYWEGVANRLKVDKRVALAMYLPVLLDQGHIGLILRGPAEAGKSTLNKALGFLRLGREPETPTGGTPRDLLAILHNEAVVHFDEVGDITPDFQTILKSLITGDKRQLRALYTNLEKVTGSLKGSAIFCTTRLERLESELRTRCFVWDLEAEGAGEFEGDILDFCKLLSRRALGGAIKLYQQAARLPRPPRSFLPEVRFRDWLSWAYRYAQVLGVADQFVAYVRKSKIAAHRGEKFEFLIDAVSNPQFDPRKEYTITDLIALADPAGGDWRWVPKALNKEGARADLIALARALGYRLRIEKKRQKGDNKPKLYFLFTPLAPGGSDRLRRLLQSVGIEPDWEGDWDGEGALPAVPLPQNGPMPAPEVHTPPPAPQIAPPAPEPVPMAAKGAADARDGTPMAPPAPEPPMPIAVQSAQSPYPPLPTPEQNERAIAGLRETLKRLPKPGGILRQRSRPIEGWVYAVAPPELTDYLRAMAGALAAEAVLEAEKGRGGKAGWLWASAAEYLVHLTAFDPTREALAGVFLARAADMALLASQAPGLGVAAGLLAKAAEMVFFGKAPHDVLLEVIAETPLPTTYDPCWAPHYRRAVGCLVAAHWVLTGGDPKPLTGWLWSGRVEAEQAEAMLLASLERQKAGMARAHLYLGVSPPNPPKNP